MATKLRLSRHGSKKKPFYWFVVADSRAPRDGDYIEKVGTYNPLLSEDKAERIVLKQDRIAYWLDKGAQPSERVIKLCKLSNIALPENIVKKHDSVLAKRIANHKALVAKKAAEEAAAQEEAAKAAQAAAAPAEPIPAPQQEETAPEAPAAE